MSGKAPKVKSLTENYSITKVKLNVIIFWQNNTKDSELGMTLLHNKFCIIYVAQEGSFLSFVYCITYKALIQ